MILRTGITLGRPRKMTKAQAIETKNLIECKKNTTPELAISYGVSSWTLARHLRDLGNL